MLAIRGLEQHSCSAFCFCTSCPPFSVLFCVAATENPNPWPETPPSRPPSSVQLHFVMSGKTWAQAESGHVNISHQAGQKPAGQRRRRTSVLLPQEPAEFHPGPGQAPPRGQRSGPADVALPLCVPATRGPGTAPHTLGLAPRQQRAFAGKSGRGAPAPSGVWEAGTGLSLPGRLSRPPWPRTGPPSSELSGSFPCAPRG